VPVKCQNNLIPWNAHLDQRRKIERRRQSFAHFDCKCRARSRTRVMQHQAPWIDIAGKVSVASVFQFDEHYNSGSQRSRNAVAADLEHRRDERWSEPRNRTANLPLLRDLRSDLPTRSEDPRRTIRRYYE